VPEAIGQKTVEVLHPRYGSSRADRRDDACATLAAVVGILNPENGDESKLRDNLNNVLSEAENVEFPEWGCRT
jgi:hypothetical protein